MDWCVQFGCLLLLIASAWCLGLRTAFLIPSHHWQKEKSIAWPLESRSLTQRLGRNDRHPRRLQSPGPGGFPDCCIEVGLRCRAWQRVRGLCNPSFGASGWLLVGSPKEFHPSRDHRSRRPCSYGRLGRSFSGCEGACSFGGGRWHLHASSIWRSC